ncbi:uncharacterized protein LOC119351009 [Triticum dicoccoides]|uniref:uncharacterized protein LOC119351009 n=1 Tax=Triticum dicoccoides TaxID=85692 RepID=UPI00188FA4FA|nr:uncharacterized protein LOC119351009 [Triticum dicoccoides]XP_044360869.1 uncharacterized protein LOC123082629 [Triticum aestivum]
MARKRKLEAAPGLDEADRTLHSAFGDAASSVSRLYSQAMAQQRHASRAGELHALEKLSQWILRRRAEEPTLTVADIMAHIQCEMEYGGGRDAQAAPRSAHRHPLVVDPETAFKPLQTSGVNQKTILY